MFSRILAIIDRALTNIEVIANALLHFLILYLYFTDKIDFVGAMTVSLLLSVVSRLSKIIEKMNE